MRKTEVTAEMITIISDVKGAFLKKSLEEMEAVMADRFFNHCIKKALESKEALLLFCLEQFALNAEGKKITASILNYHNLFENVAHDIYRQVKSL